MNIEAETRNELLELVDKIAEYQKKINEVRLKARKQHEKFDLPRARYIRKIWMAKNEKGKPLYPNETARQAELLLKLREDPECVALTKERDKLIEQLDEYEVKYVRLVNRKEVLMLG